MIEEVEQKRLYPEELLAYYERSAVVPDQGVYVNLVDNCACAFGALFVADKVNLEDSDMCERVDLGAQAKDYAEEIYGHRYVGAFINGFDRLPQERKTLDAVASWTAERMLAYQDGINAWEAVKKLAGYSTYETTLVAKESSGGDGEGLFYVLYKDQEYNVLEKREAEMASSEGEENTFRTEVYVGWRTKDAERENYGFDYDWIPIDKFYPEGYKSEEVGSIDTSN